MTVALSVPVQKSAGDPQKWARMLVPVQKNAGVLHLGDSGACPE